MQSGEYVLTGKVNISEITIPVLSASAKEGTIKRLTSLLQSRQVDLGDNQAFSFKSLAPGFQIVINICAGGKYRFVSDTRQ